MLTKSGPDLRSDPGTGGLCRANVASFFPVGEALNGLSLKCNIFCSRVFHSSVELSRRLSLLLLRVRLCLFLALL